jgi:hypothetical protein
MNNSATTSAPATGAYVFRVIFLILGAFAIYYVYKTLFTAEIKRVVLIKDVFKAESDNKKPYLFSRGIVPPIYEGGEYSVSMWIYINNFNYPTRSVNKGILTIGNVEDTDGTITLGVYLDGNENTLHIRTSYAAADNTASGPAGVISGTLKYKDYTPLFTSANQIGDNTGNRECTVSPIELQRWVHLAFTLNGKTVDTYVDGKLARSCLLPSVFKVDPKYSILVANNGGFGGYLSGVVAYDYAINPEQVYRTYMAGPLGAIGVTDYLKSFFDPKSIGTLEYPKMN